MKKLLSPLLIGCLVLVAAFSAPVSQAQNVNPIHMLVLGDSIMWGQGLKREHKSWYQVKLWMQRTTGRPVVERVEAHSGALIEPGPTDDRLAAENPEVNVARPTVNDQLDSAVKSYPDPGQVDLVLLSACGNDVGLENLLNASKAEDIEQLTVKECGTPMESLLRRIATLFPASTIIVTGYYPFFSEKTPNDFILKGLTKRFVKVIPGVARLSSKETLVRLTQNSQTMYAASNRRLKEVTQKINAEIGSTKTRIMFARIDFPPEYSFATHDTRLWEFNRSPFRMLLLLLSFGKQILPANDEVGKQRTDSCNEVFKTNSVATADQRQERQKRLMLCRYASLGHPNKLGAALYANAIIAVLPKT